ncbi:MAG: hypothetical protein B9S32_09390 [Verrucomicrobia bacterium Tous-C9LFEB]|nr:MAG: hypothetical protein B9S32_09390 [Verrucomicrobia bacterium Tous-C9LFEB]
MATTVSAKLEQVYTPLREGILSGRWKVGDRIPTENELSAEYHCSRGTVGRALARLVQEGLVERRTSDGTRVIRTELSPSVTPLELDACAFVYPSQRHEGMWRTLLGFQEAADVVARRVVSLSTGTDFRKEAEIIGRLDDFSVLGAVLLPVILGPKEMAYYTQTLLACRLPVVLVTMNIPSMERPAVVSDRFHAGYTMTQYLIGKGQRKIGFLDNTTWTRRENYLGYRQAMEEGGVTDFQKWVQLDSSMIPHFEDPTRQPIELAKAYLLAHPDVEAVVGADDFLARGLVQAAEELGRRVPDELKVVGLNQYQAAKAGAISLTTYSVDYEKMGRLSFEILNRMIAEKVTTAEEIQIRGEIIQGQSA